MRHFMISTCHQIFFFCHGSTALVDRGIIIVGVSRSHSDTPHSNRTSLGEWSARRRANYLATHNIHNRQTSKPLVGFQPAIPASKRLLTHRVTQFINLVSGWIQIGYFIVAAVFVLLLVESNKRSMFTTDCIGWSCQLILDCLIWRNPNRAQHGLDIVWCNYVLIWGTLWREMTSRSNCDVICFHNAFRGACVMKSAKKRGFNGMRCDWMRFNLISIILSIMCAKLCFTFVCVK